MEQFTDTINNIGREKILSAKRKLRQLLEEKAYPELRDAIFVTGGCIGSLIRGEEPNDIDVFFHSEVVAETYKRIIMASKMDEVKDMSAYGVDVDDDPEKCITKNAITMLNGIQYITAFTGTPNEVRSAFDFVHCTPYYDPSKDSLFISPIAYHACLNKILIVNNQKSAEKTRRSGPAQKSYRYYKLTVEQGFKEQTV
jgi:hypothetical protein